MAFTVVIYILLLIGFFVISSLIFRHTIKFGYLSPHFKTVAMIFGGLAVIIILFSIYLLILLFRSAPSDYDFGDYTNTTTTTNGDSL
jgi:uncharacterized BrkB/YihY/UPF0761 family membrane protein